MTHLRRENYNILKLSSYAPAKHSVISLWRQQYLYRGYDVRVYKMVEVFMDTVQQPEKELLGVVLCISPVLHGTLGHSILPKHTQC